MDEETFADVVPLFPLAEEGDDLHAVLPGPREQCVHLKTQLNSASRRVHCRVCGSEVDAFSVLQKLAREPQRWIDAREEAKRQAQRAMERLADLKRQEANAKARLRRAVAS